MLWVGNLYVGICVVLFVEYLEKAKQARKAFICPPHCTGYSAAAHAQLICIIYDVPLPFGMQSVFRMDSAANLHNGAPAASVMFRLACMVQHLVGSNAVASICHFAGDLAIAVGRLSRLLASKRNFIFVVANIQLYI